MENLIEVKNICKTFKVNKRTNGVPGMVANLFVPKFEKKQAVKDISFSIKEGEMVGFVGPNGAGKSTTIRTLMGLLKPTNGGASIFGLDCSREPARIPKDVGYLPIEKC